MGSIGVCGRANKTPQFLLDPSRVIETIQRTLYCGTATIDLDRHLDLAAKAPAEIIGMPTQQAQHLEIAALKPPIGDGTGRDDRITRIAHWFMSSKFRSASAGGNMLGA
jgi:hypothetical protein